jgi:hypothetical protein
MLFARKTISGTLLTAVVTAFVTHAFAVLKNGLK